MVGRELDVIGSSRFHDEARAVIDALRAGLLTLNPIVTHTFPLDDFAAAFATIIVVGNVSFPVAVLAGVVNV